MKILGYIALVLMISACVETFEFALDQSAEWLVVDAQLTNEQKAHRVTLSKSQSLQSKGSVDYVAGAKVWIESSDKQVIDLDEKSAGVYETGPSFGGTVGQSYVLHIETEEGRKYQSSAVELLRPIPMDSIYGKYVEMPSTETSELLEGVQFYVDTYGIDVSQASFRYDYEESYSVQVPFPSRLEWFADTESLKPRVEDVRTCYRSANSNELFVVSTTGLSTPQIASFPLRFVSKSDSKLRYEMQLVTRQFTISAQAYQYYRKLKENNESAGSFFDKQKGTVLGNVSEVGHPETPVLGYFEVAGSSMKVRKFSSADFRDEGYVPVLSDYSCTYDRVADTLAIEALVDAYPPGQYIYQYTDPSQSAVVLVPEKCSDCRLNGVLEKPKFWD